MDDLTEKYLKPISQIWEEVLAETKRHYRTVKHSRGVFEALQEFSAAVDWKEWWIISIFVIHVVYFAAIIRYRNSFYGCGFLFFIAATVVYFAESINKLAAEHHKLFTKQPYFDKHGIFFSAIVSAPLLFNMFVLLINYLCVTSKLLVLTKRKELQLRAKQQLSKKE